jgi:hypothetical protein
MQKKLIVVLSLILTLSACGLLRGNPVPDEYKSIVGTWKGNGVDLTVTSDGGISYHKVSGDGSFSLNGPLKTVSDTELQIKFLFFVMKLSIEKLPHDEKGQTVMTVDHQRVVQVNN